MFNLTNQNIKESFFQKKIDGDTAQCLTCERKCVIKAGKMGFCGTRTNIKGKIYTIVHGIIPALSFNPIEKKPLFHFYPGTIAITIGTYGCNFSCFWCQNHHISHPDRGIRNLVNEHQDNYISPEKLIRIALKNKVQGTSISFNEPTLLFEYSLEVFKLAKKHNLYNTYVSNGYMTESVLKELVDAGLDAINMDIKGDSKMVKKYCGGDVEKVWRNARLAKKFGIHVEITTLLIEGLNTDEKTIKEISQRIVDELGPDTPFHLTRFFPHYKSGEYGFNLPTPIKSLVKSLEIAKNTGLFFVYLGNLVGTEYENTYCPNCSKLVIRRSGFNVEIIGLNRKGKCNQCGTFICKL